MVFSNVCDDSVKKRKQLIENAANDAFLLAFTDWDELVKWSTEKEETLICTYDDLKTMVLNDPDQIKGFVINPFGQNVVITPELIHYIAQRTSEIVLRLLQLPIDIWLKMNILIW